MPISPQLIIAAIITILLATLIFFRLTNIAFASGGSNLACKETVKASGIDFLGLGIFRPSEVICNINAPH